MVIYGFRENTDHYKQESISKKIKLPSTEKKRNKQCQKKKFKTDINAELKQFYNIYKIRTVLHRNSEKRQDRREMV